MKKTTNQVIEQVYDTLAQKPKSIKEIADEIETSWESTRRALQLLKNLNLVTEKKQGNKRIFNLKKETKTRRNTETLYGVPLTKKQENQINYLFNETKKTWKQKTGDHPNKTQMQKTITKTIEDANLNIPIGWYKYGMMCVKHYNPLKEYTYTKPELDKEHTKKIIQKTIKYYSRFKTTYELKIKQYQDKKNTLYLTKEELFYNLCTQYNNKTRTNIREQITELAFSIPPKEDNKELIKYTNKFSQTMIHLFKNKTEKELNLNRAEIIQGFDSLWDLIATKTLYNSLKKYYPTTQLNTYFQQDIESKTTTVKESIEHLQGLMDPKKEETQINKQKQMLENFKGITSPKQLLTREERKKLAEQFEKNKSDIFREYDLD